MNTEKLKTDMIAINRFFYRIKNAFAIGCWALIYPDTMQANNFKMLSDLYGLIFKVAEENRHLMTHIAYVHPTEGEKQIVSIWAGAGIAADPVKRIAELIAENDKLKSILAELAMQTQN